MSRQKHRTSSQHQKPETPRVNSSRRAVLAALGALGAGAAATIALRGPAPLMPLLYTLGLLERGGSIETFCEGFQWPGISMRSLVLT